MFKLMIKTHNVTGLKYLCITKRDDYEEYLGSGLKWKKHLEKIIRRKDESSKYKQSRS